MMDRVLSVTRVFRVHTTIRLGVSLALVTTVLGAVTATTPTASSAAPGTPAEPPTIRLNRDAGAPTSAATVPLSTPSSHQLMAAQSSAKVLTRRLPTTTYKQVAATWRGSDPGVRVRTRTRGGWSDWLELEALPGQAASELMWVGPARGVQVRTTRKAADLDLVLIDPGVTRSDTTATPIAAEKATPTSATRSSALKTAAVRRAPRPTLYDRAAWHADPDWLNGKPVYTTKPKQVHIHHTASANGYSRADVPAILRGMYRYHTQTLGWFDIGYNFLVDRFGRAWIGRSGGARRMVKGAHTLGFNNNSVGIALIGNHQSSAPTAAARTKVIQLAAWKFDLHDQTGVNKKILMVSAGSDRFRKGARVWLPRIDGHRDTNETACPGAKTYALLPDFRRRTQARITTYS